jgi:hypothetical protein
MPAEDHYDDVSALEMALADIEMIRSAYPDETRSDPLSLQSSSSPCSFPLHVDLWFSDSAVCTLEFQEGYPTTTNIGVARYRTKNAGENIKVERAVAAVRRVAQENQGMESGLACCAAAMDAWNDTEEPVALDISAYPTDVRPDKKQQQQQPSRHGSDSSSFTVDSATLLFSWISGLPLVDRKSTFVAHICPISSEAQVKPALNQLISGSTRIQRATHNMVSLEMMKHDRYIYKWNSHSDLFSCLKNCACFHFLQYAYRLTEYIPSKDGKNCMIPVKKHDNDDDGEDGAGARLAHLLELRKDDGVLVVVSRWYGGIPLGPKRFAHIVNVARELLVQHATAHHQSTDC